MLTGLEFAAALIFGALVFMCVVVINIRRTQVAFQDDVVTALGTQSKAIDDLAARLTPPADPATIVPLAVQQSIVSGINANTDKVNAVNPPTA